MSDDSVKQLRIGNSLDNYPVAVVGKDNDLMQITQNSCANEPYLAESQNLVDDYIIAQLESTACSTSSHALQSTYSLIFANATLIAENLELDEYDEGAYYQRQFSPDEFTLVE